MSLSADLKLIINAVQTGALDLATQSAQLNQSLTQAYSDGAGANQANLLFSDRRTLDASANEDLDLVGSLTGLLGAAASFARIKAVIIKAASGNTNNVNVSRPASNGVPLFLAAGDGIALKPGAFFAWVDPTAAGVALTGGSADLLNIANSGGSTEVTYDIIVIGAAS